MKLSQTFPLVFVFFLSLMAIGQGGDPAEPLLRKLARILQEGGNGLTFVYYPNARTTDTNIQGRLGG